MNPLEKKYLVKDLFVTVQGEGAMAGRAAIFIRLAGCNLWSGHDEDRERDARSHKVACPVWCDTDFRREGARKMVFPELLGSVMALPTETKFIVFTGGEPLLQLDGLIMAGLHTAGYEIAIETNGTRSLSVFGERGDWRNECFPDHIVCSPKVPEPVIEHIDELKLVVPSYNPRRMQAAGTLGKWLRRVTPGKRPRLFLQPLDFPGEGVRAQTIAFITDYLHEHPEWRLSTQQHKTVGLP